MLFLRLLILSCMTLSGTVVGQEGVINKLFGPGPLIEGHKDLEHGDCLKCHDAGNGVPDKLCFDCHKDIQKSVTTKSGLHGKTKKSCLDCHKDHKGRQFDSTLVNEKTFNHDLTGFKLDGAHDKVKCDECHTKKRSEKPIRPKGVRFFGQE